MSSVNKSLLEILNDLFDSRIDRLAEVQPFYQKHLWSLTLLKVGFPSLPQEYHFNYKQILNDTLVLLEKLQNGLEIEHWPLLTDQINEIVTLNEDFQLGISRVDNVFYGNDVFLFNRVKPDIDFSKQMKHYIQNGQDVYEDILAGKQSFTFSTISATFEEFANDYTN